MKKMLFKVLCPFFETNMTSLTQQQQDIVNVEPKPGNIVLVNAVAGSGKTTTITEFCKKNTEKTILLISFGRADCAEARARLSGCWHVKVRTFDSIVQEQFGHPIGWDVTPWSYGRWAAENWSIIWNSPSFPSRYSQKKRTRQGSTFNSFMVQRDTANYIIPVLQALYAIGSAPSEDPSQSTGAIQKAISMVDDEIGSWWDKQKDTAYRLTQRIHSVLHEQTSLTAHPAMVEYARMQVALKPVPVDQNILICDEVQDLNINMMKWCNSQRHTFRMVVGDPKQHIFQFLHTTDGFDEFTKEPNFTPMDLGHSFRFGPVIANEVNRIFGTRIEGRGRGKGGIFWNVATDECVLRTCNQQEPTTFLCRTNRKLGETLITLHTVFTRRASPFDTTTLFQTLGSPTVHIMGTESLVSLQNEIDRCKKAGAKAYSSRMSEIKTGFERWACKDFGHARVEAMVDFFKSNAVLVADREQALITISTVHRFKGKECGTVHVADDLSTLSEEDQNILYVAMTRPHHTLMFAKPKF